jgi:type I restriction enzyme M protein
MLNSETKRHIDAARDVLVGVAPNPTTQIDQITYALIYKFMDDMDQAAIKAGGEPSFFVGDLEPFAWSKLVDSRMGNQEKMNLYGEALVKFSEAKQLPELFRIIFRSAFLPYRSPETLGLFLKEISYFDYSHPEELGNAYEYLLSIMSSQGDAGQFRTPRHIIDFIVDVLNPTKNDKVLDPACGTGGFLVSTYNHILEQHDGKDDPTKKEKTLTPEERKKLMQNLQGYDIDPTMVRIAQVNMYLHQFKNPQIFQYDSLTNEERWSEKFDLILANPPFMTPKGGIKPHSKFGVISNRSEVLFVDYIINHLKPKGRAGIIVPEGIIFQGGKAYKELRKILIENGLYAVVSLPGGVFQPYSGVKTSILFINTEIATEKNEIAFIKILADGFDLGATKREVTQNDLPVALELLRAFENSVKVENPILSIASKEVIGADETFNLSGDRYISEFENSQSKYEMVELGDYCDFQNGYAFKSSDMREFRDGYLPVIKIGNIGADGVIDKDCEYHEYTEKLDKFLLVEGDIVIAMTGATVGKVAMISEGKYLMNQRVGKITLKSEALTSDYLKTTLQSSKFYDYCQINATGGAQGNISGQEILKFKIPLVPLVVQAEVCGLDSYDSIISGAKQISDNWKPRVDIDTSWPLIKLENLCELITKGTTPTSVGYKFQDDGVNFIKVESIGKNGDFVPTKFAHISTECHESLSRSQLRKNDILFSIAGALGRVALVSEDVLPANINQALAVLRLKTEDKVIPQFLYYLLSTDFIGIQLKFNQTGVAQQNLSLSQLGTFLVPVPPIDVQMTVIRSIEAEQILVHNSSKLASVFETRKKNVVEKLWSF